jgi:acyl-CoA dehydrogenase
VTRFLLDPHALDRPYEDDRSREVMAKTVEWFEQRGKARLKDDDHAAVWYQDFLDFIAAEGIFATMCTPAGLGAEDSRWDTWRICEFAEILGFYGLQYWYTWQVSVLGLGPLWMSKNQRLRERAAALLAEGGIFAFGLSEKEHGADLYSTDMVLEPQEDGTYRANGGKYYIGNGNQAALVSVFGKLPDGNPVAFAVSSQHECYELVKNVVWSQNYVSEFRLHDYPVTEDDIIAVGADAWNAGLNTVNIGKYNLGWASIGICTHAMYEAVTHAHNRVLYGHPVTEFAHVKQLFTDAYVRLVAMKLVALRAADYFRSASLADRRYLLFNPVVKMKVTTQGEDVINHLWDVIAARGFEKETYFEAAARDIRGLPKLEGTVHVNISLIVKFMANYFFDPIDVPDVPQRADAANDDFLFDQGPTGGLSTVRFGDWRAPFAGIDLPNVKVFFEQAEVFVKLLGDAPLDEEQSRDIDVLLAVGEIFTLVVYAQLVLENAPIYAIDDDVIDQMFDTFVRDVSRFAVQLHGKASTTQKQQDLCLALIRKPVVDPDRYDRVWQGSVLAMSGAYAMNP